MPVEILELIVRAEVQDTPQSGDIQAGPDESTPAATPSSADDMAEQISEIFKRKKER